MSAIESMKDFLDWNNSTDKNKFNNISKSVADAMHMICYHNSGTNYADLACCGNCAKAVICYRNTQFGLDDMNCCCTAWTNDKLTEEQRKKDD